jgi:hypothetical protein
MKRLGDRSRRSGLVLALVLLAIVLDSRPATASAAPPPPIEILESSFRQGRTDRLRELMPPGDKVYLSSASLGIDNGYYSPDQVCLLMQEIFRTRMTVRFNFVSGASFPKGAKRVVAVSHWTYRRGKSKEQSMELAFTLIRRDGAWLLKEFRDVP